MSRMLLFLDFDGVMHQVGAPVDQLFCHLELFESWPRFQPDVQIVIASSWRVGHPLDEIASFFSPDLQDRVIGITPRIARTARVADAQAHERYVEVLAWLQENRRLHRPWAALDDQADLFPVGLPNLVVCDGARGLDMACLEAIGDLLVDWTTGRLDD